MISISYHKALSIFSMSIVPFIFSIEGDFVFDDSEAIVKNQDVTSESWYELFSHDFWGSNITSDFSHKSYRPLTILSFRLNYLLNFKSLIASHFKMTNLACHSLCCLLIWQMIEKIINRMQFHARTIYSIDIAYSTALLFGVHPVHTEAVCGIVGRADVLAAATFFLCIIFYEKAMDSTVFKYLYLLIAIVLAGCSMLFKENGITVLGLCIVYELIANLKIKTKTDISLCKESIVRIVSIIIAAICLLYGRWTIMGGTKPTFKPTDNPTAFSDDYFVKMATYSYIYFLNMLLFIWPHWLCYDWSMGCVPLIKSTEDYRCAWVFLFYVFAIIFVTSIFVINKKSSTRRMLLVAISLIIIPFLPAANILYPVGFVIAERILYISSVGYCLIICISLNKIIQVDKARLTGLLFFLLLLTTYAGRSWQRAKEWQNEYKLFLSGLSVCPLNAKIHYNVAKVTDAANDTSWALYEYEEAIRLYPEYYQAMNNLANLLKNENKLNEAELYLKSALHYKQDFPAAWMNLGIVYANTQRFDEALTAYKTALFFRKKYPDCHYNIGNLFLELNKSDEAMKHWEKAISLKPDHMPAWTNVISLLDNSGQREKALQIIPEVLKVLSDSPSINFAVANIYGKIDDYEEAEKHFLKAISLFGIRVQAIHYSNLGVLYHRWKKFDLAEAMYKKALKIDPRSRNIMKNLRRIQKIKKG